MTIITTTVEIFFEDLKNDFPALKDQNGKLIQDEDKLLEIAETLDDEEIFEKHIEKTRYLHSTYHRFDCVNLPEYFDGENLKIIDSDYFGELEGIVLTVEYSINKTKGKNQMKIEKLDELKILAKNIDLTEVKEIEHFIQICETHDSAKNLYLKGLKKIYLKTIEELEELEISGGDLESVKNQNFKINPLYRHSGLKIYLTALED